MIAWFSAQPLEFRIVLGGLGSVLLVFLLWRLWLRKYLEWQNVKSLDIKERVGLKIEFIKTAAQILGGAFFLLTIYVAWANLEVSQEKYKTDLFVQAIKQLGDEKMEVRLGGIYALERIARDSEKDHGPIMEVLTAFVRLHAPAPREKPAEARELPAESGKPAPEVAPPADIQAILAVLGRRARTYGKGETQRLDLRQTDLRGAILWQAHLEGATLMGARLEGADLQEAHLEGSELEQVNLARANLFDTHMENAYLKEAHFEGADLFEAHLEGARLWNAHMEGADLTQAYLGDAKLRKAHLQGANLMGAHLEGAHLIEAHLEKAKFSGAHLEGAFLVAAHLEGACLEGAYLEGANLLGAEGLTQMQIESASINKNTKLPEYLKMVVPDKSAPRRWVIPHVVRPRR